MAKKITHIEVKTWNREFNVQIAKNESIRLVAEGIDKTFKVGDMAEYDSYNLSYLGEIMAISDKTVTIKPRYDSRVKRLKLYNFVWRNYDFDLDKKNAENANTMNYI